MILKELVKRLKLRRLRRVLRGHRILEKSGLLWKLNVINDALATAECNKGKNYTRIIFGAAVAKEELVTRQYLLAHFAGDRLVKALQYAHGKDGSAVVYPLPIEWRKIVESQGFKVAKVRSTLLWHGYMVIFLAYGIFSIGKRAYQGFKEIIRPSFQELGKFVFLEGLTTSNLPRTSKGEDISHDIVTWYQQWPGRVSDLDTICHSVKGVKQSAVQGIPLVSVTSGIPPLNRLNALLRYIGWGFSAIVWTTIDLLRGRWWHALLLNQAALAVQVKLAPSRSLAREYLFHNSSCIYRPLWTYEAEKHGSVVTLYFYSTNCEGFKRLDGHTPIYFGYKVMNWPRYLVWDGYQAEFIRNVVGEHALIIVVGMIWFSASAAETPVLPPKSIAVFDVQPMRNAFYKTLGIDFDYYTPKTANRFLSDIYMVLKESDCMLALKRKRNIGKLIHPLYRNFIEKLAMQPNFIAVEPDISAWSLIEKSIAVISMPFTSTALLGRALDKPTVYYDPSGVLQKNEQPSHGIEILSGPDELRAWLKSVLKVNT